METPSGFLIAASFLFLSNLSAYHKPINIIRPVFVSAHTNHYLVWFKRGYWKHTREIISKETISRKMDAAKSYATRIKGLQKKIEEFSILVGVDACMLVYGGPKQSVDTYPKPQNLGDLIRILRRYLSLPQQERTRKHQNLSVVSGDGGKNKIDEDNSSEFAGDNSNADGLEWDDRFDKLSADQIQQLIDSVDAKIDTIDEKIQLAERTAENPSCMTSRSSDHGVGAAPAATTTTSWGGHTSMQQMQPVYILQPFNQNLENGSGMVPMMMQYPMMAIQPGGGNQMPMMAVQPGGGNQMVFGNHQGPVTYFMPQAFVQPMPTSSYIPNLMPRGDA